LRFELILFEICPSLLLSYFTQAIAVRNVGVVVQYNNA